MRWVVCAECKRRLPHHAHGKCIDCYQRSYRASHQLGLCKDPQCPGRGSRVPIIARGLCFACYNRNRRAGTLARYPTIRQQQERQPTC